MDNLALITGGSGGIGFAMAEEHAKAGGDMILVARSKTKLIEAKKELEARFKVNVIAKPMDLAGPESAGQLLSWLEKEGHELEILVNNAGFGGHGLFVERAWEDDLAMIQLNATTLTALMRGALPGMVERGRGSILNVGSTAGFVPGPMQAVYYATKAYVNSLSQAVNEELRGTGVSVTVLCPGPVNTNFEAAAGMPKLKLFKGAISAEATAKAGYRAMCKGRDVVVVPRTMGPMLRAAGMLPRRAVVRASRKTMEK